MDASTLERFEYSELRIINNRKRRNRELKRHIIMAIIGALLFIVVSIIIFSNKSIASDGSEEVLYKYYKSIQICEGDSLTSLSHEYSDNTKAFINEVLFINSLENADSIKTGDYIVIPYYDVLR